MTDSRSDIKKIEEAMADTIAAHERLVAIGEERKLLREEARAILHQMRAESTKRHDAWMIALIIMIIIEILLGMIWGMI